MYISQRIAEFTKELGFNKLPSEVVSSTKLRFLEVIGLCLAGSEVEPTKIVADIIKSMHGNAESTAIGFNFKAPATNTAVINGVTCETFEYSDTYRGVPSSGIHPSSVIIPATLAAGEKINVDGKSLITAAVAGNEIICRIGGAATTKFSKRGFHSTAVCGVFAAGMVAGKLLGLSTVQLANALGICGSLASGLHEFMADGSLVKQIHDGCAAQNGIFAALLAQRGFTGPLSIFEGKLGFFNAFLGEGHYDINKLTEKLNENWETMKIVSRPYPLGNLSNPFMEAALFLKKKYNISVNDVELINCFVAPEIIHLICEPIQEKHNPSTPYSAKYSLPYAVALFLLKERVVVDDFLTEDFKEPKILLLASKVKYTPDPGRRQDSGLVEIKLKDNTSFRHEVPYKKGSLENPVTEEEVKTKYINNASRVLGREKVYKIMEKIEKLENIEQIGMITEMIMDKDGTRS